MLFPKHRTVFLATTILVAACGKQSDDKDQVPTPVPGPPISEDAVKTFEGNFTNSFKFPKAVQDELLKQYVGLSTKKLEYQSSELPSPQHTLVLKVQSVEESGGMLGPIMNLSRPENIAGSLLFQQYGYVDPLTSTQRSSLSVSLEMDIQSSEEISAQPEGSYKLEAATSLMLNSYNGSIATAKVAIFCDDNAIAADDSNEISGDLNGLATKLQVFASTKAFDIRQCAGTLRLRLNVTAGSIRIDEVLWNVIKA